MIAHEIPAIPVPAGPGPTVRVPGRVCRGKTPGIQAVTGSMSGVPDTEPTGIDGRVPVSVGRKSNHINRLTLSCRNRVSGENAVKTMAWPPGVGIACRGDCVSGVGVSDPTCRALIQRYQSLSVTVSDLRVGEKVNEIKGVGCRGLLYIHIWVCSRNTHPYWLGLRLGPGTAPHPPILDDGEAVTPPPRCMAFAATDGAARRPPHTNPPPSQRKDTASQDLNSRDGWRRRSWKFPAATLTTTTPIEGVHHGSCNSAQEPAA